MRQRRLGLLRLPVMVRGFYALGDRLTPVRDRHWRRRLEPGAGSDAGLAAGRGRPGRFDGRFSRRRGARLALIFSKRRAPLGWRSLAAATVRTAGATLLMALAVGAALHWITPSAGLGNSLLRVCVPLRRWALQYTAQPIRFSAGGNCGCCCKGRDRENEGGGMTRISPIIDTQRALRYSKATPRTAGAGLRGNRFSRTPDSDFWVENMNWAELLRATYNFAPSITSTAASSTSGTRPSNVGRRGDAAGCPDGQAVGDPATGRISRPRRSPNCLGLTSPATIRSACWVGASRPSIRRWKRRLIETTDQYDIVRDEAGRTVRFKKGRRHGFMPTYLKHAVANDKDWEEEHRAAAFARGARPLERLARTLADPNRRRPRQVPVAAGHWRLHVSAGMVGPTELCYMFADNPQLIHKMMQSWLALADAVTARVQEHVELDELFLAEDICYNHGLLISPNMVREFLLPYYQQLVANLRARQKGKRLHVQVDSDGYIHDAIDLYLEIGMDCMSPFEVAAGNDLLDLAENTRIW